MAENQNNQNSTDDINKKRSEADLKRRQEEEARKQKEEETQAKQKAKEEAQAKAEQEPSEDTGLTKKQIADAEKRQHEVKTKLEKLNKQQELGGTISGDTLYISLGDSLSIIDLNDLGSKMDLLAEYDVKGHLTIRNGKQTLVITDCDI